MSETILPEHYGQHDECAYCAEVEKDQLNKETKHTLRIGPACCTECGTDLDKHDYAFYRIGLLRAEIKVAIRLLRQFVTPGTVVRELEKVLLETRFDYRPKSREPLK